MTRSPDRKLAPLECGVTKMRGDVLAVVNACADCALFAVLVGGLRRQLQLLIDLIEQLLRLLRVACQIPLVGLLRRDDLVEGLLAEPLCRGKIRVTSGGHILNGFLGRGNHPYQEQNTKNSSANSGFYHEDIL